ncbi:cytochrome P450 [Seiridium cupressi]
MSVIVYSAAIALVAWIIYARKAAAPQKVNLPYVEFDDGNNSPERYRSDYEAILRKGYEQYTSKGLPYSMKDPNDPDRPLAMLPLKYVDEVKWIPEERISFWKHIDKQSILTQIGGPGITEEVARAARQGLNKALVYLIEDLQRACGVAYAKEMPSCPEWTTIPPYPLIMKVFASMSARMIVGPELCGFDSEWQQLSMEYVRNALSSPGKVKVAYPRWLYWLAQYTDSGVRKMRSIQEHASQILTPILQNRIAATEELKAKGGNKSRGPRKYEDGVQWLLDAHSAHGKELSTTQLARDLFVIMTASIHSTTGAGLCILFDMMDHPDVIDEIRDEIQRVQGTLAGGIWTRAALGELRLLDSFMRESARFHALTQYTAVQRIPTTPWTFKDGLQIPAGTTFAFPSFHYNFDPKIHSNPEVFDAKRHLRKRGNLSDTHKYHFASTSEDSVNWGAGRHACPGRFFAQETLKLMLMHLLMNYDIKHDKTLEDTPRFLNHNLFVIPNPALPLLFKERKRVV